MRNWIFIGLLAFLLPPVATGCGDDDDDSADGDADSDSDSDSDADGDSDSDTDSDSDSDTDTDTDSDTDADTDADTDSDSDADTDADSDADADECESDQECENGSQWSSLCCPAAGENRHCVGIDWDPANCGGCGQPCPDDEPMCRMGECTSCGQMGLDECDGVCVDLATDHDHCGKCGNPCAEGAMCVVGECVAGECDADCPPPPDDGVVLPGDPAVCCGNPRGEGGEGCTDVRMDRWNCGGCGNACGDEEGCFDGECGP